MSHQLIFDWAWAETDHSSLGVLLRTFALKKNMVLIYIMVEGSRLQYCNDISVLCRNWSVNAGVYNPLERIAVYPILCSTFVERHTDTFSPICSTSEKIRNWKRFKGSCCDKWPWLSFIHDMDTFSGCQKRGLMITCDPICLAIIHYCFFCFIHLKDFFLISSEI